MNIPTPHVVGLVWVREEDYAAFRALFADADKMPETWKGWLKAAEKTEQQHLGQGYLVERVYIDPDTFVDWCAAHGCSVDAEGRRYFIATYLAEKHHKH